MVCEKTYSFNINWKKLPAEKKVFLPPPIMKWLLPNTEHDCELVCSKLLEGMYGEAVKKKVGWGGDLQKGGNILTRDVVRVQQIYLDHRLGASQTQQLAMLTVNCQKLLL